ncbi:MAG: FxsA family protein [Dehalococcoidales bacterium]|jgi:UPF0716 protein FxsA|nr:FxsA family protein [Dehalococcoidales bacterium]MDD4465381.1 FxsA family protein [Dehalococcoidales bacterium]
MVVKIIFAIGLLFAVDMAIMAVVARFFGALSVVAVIVSTALVGAFVLLQLGPAAARRLRASLTGSAVPEEGILHTILLFLAGVLLITPGIMADMLGLLLLLPKFRSMIAGKARKIAEKLVNRGAVRVARINQRNQWPK